MHGLSTIQLLNLQSLADHAQRQLERFNRLYSENPEPCQTFQPVYNPNRATDFIYCGTCGHAHS